jgi:hypothetical protein
MSNGTNNSGETKGMREKVERLTQRIVKHSNGKVSQRDAKQKAIHHANRIDRRNGRG